ncbi:(ABC) transporter [Rhizoctonia solani]|uniref:(ABC) transporter n=1 Tax=Rhizoctonia solani TaxID=456999 RepID=A0A8H7M401_9AGAM|nr:(ABC) transporter [Rhizoctonia solani]
MTATEKSADVALSDSKEFSNDKPVVSEYGSKKPKREYRFREERLGVWSLYYPITNSWREYLPALESLWVLYDMAKSLPIIWAFVLETLSLGPIFFVAYFISSTLVDFCLLFNCITIRTLWHFTMTGKHVDREQFRQIAISYFAVFSAGLIFHKIEAYSRPILQQRVSLHFKQRLLEVQSRIDLATSENPDVQSKTSRASAWFASPWSILEGLASLLAVIAEVSGQVSMFFRMMDSRQDARLFAFLCVARPLGFFAFVKTRHGLYYSMVTDARWLRMQALFDLGTKSSYKKEIIADGLEGFINSQYEKDRKSLGDMSLQAPYEQQSDRSWLTYNDFDGIFDALPLLAFAWINIRTGGKSDLSSLVLIQQATSSLQQTLFGMIYGGNNIANLFKNVMSLYDVLELKPTMVDGEIHYPEEGHKSQKGMAIEFKSVTFKYPMTDKVILKDMSFSISSGQLCVIVGENGCGKSTTINLITRMYDSTSGEVLVDGRPLKEFKLSTYRETTSVMYQDYQHLPLTARLSELKRRVEEAARLGGAFDFVQKLPLKFETNLEPQQTGYVNTWEDDDEEEKNIFQKFIDSQKATKLSGGEWQRLALSKSFMKNSEKVRLLCYDEPSASLDPKAEYETFERLRQLRGGKTMIFVTHRFGHLTKHADLILYVKEGSIVEKGTHKQLLELDGEYAKVYRIQSQAFEDPAADFARYKLHSSPNHFYFFIITRPSIGYLFHYSHKPLVKGLFGLPAYLLITNCTMVLGRLVHYGVDVVLVSAVLAGVKKSTGYTPQTNLITEPTLKSVADSVLGIGETVFGVIQGNAVTSSYFKRESR